MNRKCNFWNIKANKIQMHRFPGEHYVSGEAIDLPTNFLQIGFIGSHTRFNPLY